MIRFGLISIFIFSQLSISCAENGNDSDILKFSVETKTVYFNSLKTHEVIVYGHKTDNKIFPEKICVRKSDDKSEEVKYEPADQASLENSGFDLS